MDVSTQIRFRKEDELRKRKTSLRDRAKVAAAERLKILTSCPNCRQGLRRYGNDLQRGLPEADYIVVERAQLILGETWMPKYLAKAHQ